MANYPLQTSRNHFISIHLDSRWNEQRFSDGSDFIVRSDDDVKDFGNLKEDVHSNGSAVLEQLNAIITLDELHKFAWADVLKCKIDTTNFTVQKDDRSAWKLMWKFLDLLRQQQALKLDELVK